MNRQERRQLIGSPESLLTFLTLAGSLLYGIAILGYREFYRTIGADLEEVGLNYLQIVTQAALGTMILIVVVILAAMLGHRLELSTPEGQFFGFYILCVTVMIGLSFNGGRRISLIALIALAVISVPMGIWAFLHKLDKPLTSFGVLLFIIILIFTPIIVGRELAKETKAGETETSTSLLAFLRIRVRLVQATWTKDPPGWANSSRLYYYLGEADGVILLYDREACTVHRLSMEGTEGVSLSTVSKSEAALVYRMHDVPDLPSDCAA
jgi:hypothetical protein